MSIKPVFNRVAIVGLGMIGGSLGLSINRGSVAAEVMGIDHSREILEQAILCGAAHNVSPDLDKVDGCDLIILATPVRTTLGLLEKLGTYISPGTIITDVGSTKVEIVERASQTLPPGVVFIGGHPMAGSEKEGIGSADPYLFENAFYVLTPSSGTAAEYTGRLIRLVKSLGASPVIMDPVEHDLSVAAVSHLPHLVAATLVNCLFDLPGAEKISLLAAGGFRDTTRIAAGNPGMWRDIFLTNRQFILDALSSFKGRLDQIEKAVAAEDAEVIYQLLSRARELKSGMPARTKGYLPELWEIVVTVPDIPGVIAKIAGVLGNEGININDIEIMRIREGEGGTIRLAFGSGEDQAKALAILNQAGIQTRIL